MNADVFRPVLWFLFLSYLIILPAAGTDRLPQDHPYQVILRDYMAALDAADFEVAPVPFEWKDEWIGQDDLQELHRTWLLARHGPLGSYARGIAAAPELFTLESIESPDGIRMNASWALSEAVAWLAAWNHPANPYHAHGGLVNRALVACATDLLHWGGFSLFIFIGVYFGFHWIFIGVVPRYVLI